MTLTGAQTDVLDAVLERLIPADENGAGAREAGVGRYVARALGAEHAGHRDAYEFGLAALDEAARGRHGLGFADLTAALQDALLSEAERREDAFFELVRRHAIEGFFGDPSWGGNAARAGWTLLGYSGPRREWSEREQALDSVG